MNFERLFALAKQKGIEDVQVYLVNRSELSIEVFDGELDKYEIADTTTLSIKGVYHKRMGTFSTEVLDDSLIESIVDNLIANASIIDSLDEAVIYAGDLEYHVLDDLFNEELTKMDVANKIAKVKQLDQLFHQANPLVSIVETMYSESTRTVLLQNTKGLKLENKVNSAMIGGQIIVKNESDQRTAFDLAISNDFADFDLEKIAKEAVESGVRKLGAKPIPSKNYEIILDKDALATLLSAFQNVFSAEAVQKGLSLLKGKLGSTIGSSLFTLVDDPFMKKSSRSRSFDDEGVATKYKELIKAGVLETYLHNLTTAKKDGVVSTGNGFGTSVSAINLKVLPGEHSYQDLLSSMKEGIVITDLQGAHAGANPVSGDFSLQATGFLVENGVEIKPVALITIAGNFIKLLQDITAVGNDIKTGYYGITCPSVKILSLPVSGI
ncbi:MAG: TldD/PmbA family protein [bacterium]|nr:TldD/PmbA family protein [bacterium]